MSVTFSDKSGCRGFGKCIGWWCGDIWTLDCSRYEAARVVEYQGLVAMGGWRVLASPTSRVPVWRAALRYPRVAPSVTLASVSRSVIQACAQCPAIRTVIVGRALAVRRLLLLFVNVDAA